MMTGGVEKYALFLKRADNDDEDEASFLSRASSSKQIVFCM